MSDQKDLKPQRVAEPEVPGDVTEPLGGVGSGEADYVAVNGSGISGERHVPKGDEEIGRGEEYDAEAERAANAGS